MHTQLQTWIAELRHSTVVLTSELGSGANENLWTIAIPSGSDINSQQLVEFLLQAKSVRREQVSDAPFGPAVFYVWHDEMAGQIRFSVLRGTFDDLPFSSPVQRVDELDEIVRSYVNSPHRHVIPWTELADGNFAGDATSEDRPVCVWAERLT